METYEQYTIPAKAVGRHEAFLKENEMIEVLFGENRVLSIAFPKIVELKVINTAPGVKGQSDTTYKEAELENGIKVLVPQFIREGEKIRLNTEDLSYLERVTVKSMS
jgi:elongation factor P